MTYPTRGFRSTKETQIYSSFLRRQEPSGFKHREDTGFLPSQERRWSLFSNKSAFP